jgi:dynactin 5
MDQFLVTSSGNVVSRQSVLPGSGKIRLKGKTIVERGCVLRGDLSSINIGSYTCLGKNVAVRAPSKLVKSKLHYIAVQIGSHVHVEDDCVLEAALIGSHCHIGARAVLGARCVLQPCAVVLPDAVVPPDTVVAPFSVYGGNPAAPVGDAMPLADSFEEQREQQSQDHYDDFVREHKLTMKAKQ